MSYRTSGRRRAAPRARATFLAVLLSMASGCSVYDPDLVGGGPLGPGDLPLRPPSSTTTPGDSQELVFALKDIVLSQNGTADPTLWRSIGLDLDHLNTQNNTETECLPPSKSPWLDGEDGIDNVLGQSLWGSIEAGLDTLPCEIRVSHEAGHGTLLLRIRNWNGQSEDAQVEASFAPSIDGTSEAITNPTWVGFELQSQAVPGQPADPPIWDPPTLNYFFLNPRFFVGGTVPLVINSEAYITDNTIVFKLPGGTGFELITDLRSVPIAITEGYIVAPMDENHTNIVDGFFAGRYPINKMGVVGPSIGVCDPAQQQSLLSLYSNAGDLLEESPATIEPDPNLKPPCNAVSMGVRFQAAAAVWGGIHDTPQPAPVYCDTMPPPPIECTTP